MTRTRPRLAFTGLAIGLTWALVLPSIVQARSGLDAGVPRWWPAVGALGPLVAAAIVVRALEGPRGVRCWLSRWGDWRPSVGWWSVALIGPLVVAVLAAAGAWAVTGRPVHHEAITVAWHDVPDFLLDALPAMALGILGEPGWRGFLLPSLRRSCGPLRAAVRLVPLWAAWLVPYLLLVEGVPFTWPVILLGVGGLTATAIVLDWLAEQSGSVLLPSLALGEGAALGAVARVAMPEALPAAVVLLGIAALAIAVHWWIVPRQAELERRRTHADTFGCVPGQPSRPPRRA